jgi:glutaconate CoA-transferase subunit B
MEPDPQTRELTVTRLHPGVSPEQVVGATGWAIRFVANVSETAAPGEHELRVLRQLRLDTEQAHQAKEPA